ncbi:MAG: AAA family ATPase [Alphaproteobacteria bacterium]|nr:AAA family ATPase [Alphaproteobacteria bacterium]
MTDLSSNIMDQQIVDGELQKPIEIDKEMKRLYGAEPDGTEQAVQYTLRDRWIITQELDRIYRLMTKDLKPREEGKPKKFYMTAGGPGAGKTVLVRAMQENGGPLSQAVHVDPDEVLKSFKPYRDMVNGMGGSDAARAMAYTYWRWASVYMANTIINKLSADGHDIVFGTTGTSPGMPKIYSAAKAAGYETHVMICHAGEGVRLDGVAQRFAQERRFTPEEDAKNKGNRMFPEMATVHFANADHVSLYWRGGNAPPVLAAESAEGKIIVQDDAARKAFETELMLRKPDSTWAQLVDAYEKRFKKPSTMAPKLAQ